MMTIPRAAVATMKFFGTCEYILDSGFGSGDLSLVLEILHVCTHVHVRSHEFRAWTDVHRPISTHTHSTMFKNSLPSLHPTDRKFYRLSQHKKFQ